jgi:uncharacterized membrane protein
MTKTMSRRTGSGRLAGLVHGAATLTMGLIAGVFFDWTVSIMPALAQSDDRTFVVVMQKTITTMNSSPAFLFSFTGAFVFTGAAAILQHRLGARTAVRWILAALALYVVAIVITMGVHPPLNEALVSAGDPDKIADIAAIRKDVEGPWMNAHMVRTVAVTVALTFLCRALWLRRGGEASGSGAAPARPGGNES